MNLRIEIILLLLLVVAVAAGVVGLSACFVRPQEAIASAEFAIEGARSAGAARHAAQLLEKSITDYQAAVAEMDRQDQKWLLLRSYKKAEALLASAEAAAQDARTRGRSEHKKLRETEAAIDVAAIDLAGAARALEWNKDKIPRGERESLKTTLDELETALQKARELLEEGDYDGAKSAVKSVMQECNYITDQIRNVT